MHDLEQAIRERAYHLWIEGGCQDGQANQHWLAAQRSILGALISASEAPKALAKSKKARAPRRKKAA